MKSHHQTYLNSQGFSMMELLIVLVILLFGMLGLAGLMVTSQQGEFESYQRAQALALLNDMVSRLQANPDAAGCYAITNADTGAPYVGTGNSAEATCMAGSIEVSQSAENDMKIWDALLKGASVGDNAGAMVNARGCVSLLDATNRIYLVSVVWEGIGRTTAPNSGLACGKNLYPSEAQRRAIGTTVRLANLST